jgi:signal transduction histidine kinase
MPKDVIERAFDPFFTPKPLGEGTGLGLSLIYGVVVDDEPAIRMLVTEVLGDLGYRAIEADDGVSGLKLLETSTTLAYFIEFGYF